MTREEALAQLRNGPGINEDVSEEYNEAVDMAIKALEQESYYKDLAESYEKTINKLTKAIAEQEPCKDVPDTNVGKYKDAISRQAVRDTIFAECSGTKLDIDFAKVLILQRAIKALPPVQPKSRWIPVSERLPEKGGDYLVTTEWKGSYSGDVYIETNMAVYREKEGKWDCAGVIAWQPLPEPYEPSN